jgi:SPOR domain
MADDKTYRSNRGPDPYRGSGQPSRSNEPVGDPLAELARLIGRSDPFAELGRSHQQRQPPEQRAAPSVENDRRYATPSQLYGDGSRAAGYSHDSDPVSDYAPAQPRHREFDDLRAPVDPHAYSPSWPAAEGSGYETQQSGYEPQQGEYRRDWAAPEPQDSRHPSQSYDQRYDPSYGYPADREQRHGASYDTDPQSVHARGEADEVDYQYEDDAPLSAHDDDGYDDAPRARSHGGLATALALIGCAMLGTAGAYAYRSYASPAGTAQTPPIITADRTTPTKIVPAVDPQSTKAMQDRVATAGGGEQVVSKQEEPLPPRDLGTQSAPRVVLPAPVAPTTGGAAQPGSPNAGDAKRVRTVIIRPDGTDPSARPVGTLPSAPAPQRPTASPQSTGTTPPAPKPAPRSGGPISLDAVDTAPVPARSRTAALPATAEPAGESSGAAGGFVVQVSSQGTESEAQAVFRTLQAKYPTELSGRQPIIRRVDLGSKGGVRYRTLVGPFASVREANQFCATYKAAGGQCFLQTD